jgi:hypothetical protein
MTETSEQVRVRLIGPNLPAQAKATFHVHVDGCADLTRGWIKRYVEGSWTMDACSALDVEAEVYDFAADENPDYTLGDYQSEFHFAPCVQFPEEER